ncbi:MAG TPA: mechanosensitive ion channel family protein [Nocardioidaceae bacterium]|jgi:small conductance mechanosensitive channel|nr:mechanosensitive ion channel family protein [Nocardioidaceae bacterium]
MSLLENTTVCQNVDSNSCDIVMNVTGNETLALAAEWVIGKPLMILWLLLLGFLGRWLLHRIIDRITNKAAEGVVPNKLTRAKLGRGKESSMVSGSPGAARRVQRAQAMGSLLKSISSGVVIAIVVVMILAEVGVNVAPIIAGAGIIGVALGFGSQTLVKDFLSGIFMIFEDQYGVGDVVDLEYASGTVEAVSLRVTRLRDVDGTVWYVRNGEILRVGNMSQNWARTVLDISVGYEEDLARVQKVLKDVAHDLWEDDEFKHSIIEEPEVWGVQDLAPEAVVVRVVLKTAPLEQWEVAREMRQRVKARFDHEGIEIPLPQRVVWHRESPGQKSEPMPSPEHV